MIGFIAYPEGADATEGSQNHGDGIRASIPFAHAVFELNDGRVLPNVGVGVETHKTGLFAFAGLIHEMLLRWCWC